ncbi:MAG: hypothetical protein LBL34_00415 [Clostridiales bacterium]|nr:hypothetical protein [Clostridiales bacterium]
MDNNKIKVPTNANIKNKGYMWIYRMIFYAFIISLVFSVVTAGIIPNIPIWSEVIVIFAFIALNIVFDLVGTAVAAASQVPFHSMNSRNVKGTKRALFLIRNGEKVSNFCNDVVGDICGVVSGGATAILVNSLIASYALNPLYTSIISTSLVAGFIISGKAFGKTIALKNSNQIVYQTALLLCFIKKEK